MIPPTHPDFFRALPVSLPAWTAAHEGGHAAVCLALGVKVYEARIGDEARIVHGADEARAWLIQAGGVAGERVLLGGDAGGFVPAHLARPDEPTACPEAVFAGADALPPHEDLGALLAACRSASARARRRHVAAAFDEATRLLRPHALRLEALARCLALRGRLGGPLIRLIWARPALFGPRTILSTFETIDDHEARRKGTHEKARAA